MLWRTKNWKKIRGKLCSLNMSICTNFHLVSIEWCLFIHSRLVDKIINVEFMWFILFNCGKWIASILIHSIWEINITHQVPIHLFHYCWMSWSCFFKINMEFAIPVDWSEPFLMGNCRFSSSFVFHKMLFEVP